MRHSPTRPAGARILAVGDYRPAKVLTNDDLASMVDTSDEWIQSRVGVRTRHIAADDETVIDMAVAAGGKALAASGLEADDIDLVIVATWTARETLPSAAPTVASRLGIAAPGAFDLNAACAGFCYALSTAADAVRGGSARNVLVIASEKMSAWVDWTDRSTCVIFGDGAGAVVVGPSDNEGDIGPVVWGSEGAMASVITLTDERKLTQDGQAVYRWTMGMGEVARQACERAGIKTTDLDAVVAHQANLRIIDAIVRRLEVPHAIVATDVIETGNTSAASVPLALARLVEQGELPSGATTLLIAFGGGLSWAAQVVTAP
ncbi:MAG: beta-ketoacyl-ACP synthase III [Mycobacteriales bacterium]